MSEWVRSEALPLPRSLAPLFASLRLLGSLTHLFPIYTHSTLTFQLFSRKNSLFHDKKEGQIIILCPSIWLYGNLLLTATGGGFPVVVTMEHSPKAPYILQQDHVDVNNEEGDKYIGKEVMENTKCHKSA